MLSGKHRADQFTKAYGFKVEFSGCAAPDSTEGGWRSVQGGGLRIHEDDGVTRGVDQFSSQTRGICEWEPLTFVGALTKDRKDMLTWYKNMQQKGKEADCYKDVSITLLGPDGADVYTINYLECFLSAYSLCPLNSLESDVEAQETIEICVGYSDNLLNG